MTSRTVAVVGLGPRGLSVLERLAENARHDATEHLTVHLIDSHALGSGRVWRPEQSPELLMNTVASQVTLFTDDSVSCAGPVVPGPSLYEWARNAVHLAQLRTTAPHLEAEAARLGPDDYPTRALYGRYLQWVLEHVSARLPATVHLVPRHTRVRAITRGPEGRLVLETSDSGRISADQCVLTLGHLPGASGPRERGLRDFAARHGLRYYPMANPADVDLRDIEPGEGVLVCGLGLNFFDYLALLTTGRGGRFVETGDGLKYLPSGAEPYLHAGSRRGVPYHARGHNQKGVTGRHLPRFLTPGAISGLRRRAADGGLDFDRDVWPLVCREVEYVYYRALGEERARWADGADADGAERSGAGCADDDALLAAVAGDPAVKARALAALGFTAEDHWDWADVRTPYRDAAFADHGAFSAWLLDHLAQDVRDAVGGNVRNPRKAALDALRDLRNEVRQVVDHGGILPDSHRDALDGHYTPLNAFVSIGPPARRIEELIALMKAGIVTVGGPGFTVEAHPDGHFTGHAPGLPGSRREARVLIDARLPPAGIAHTDDPLTGQLLTDGLARLHTLRHGDAVHTTGALEVTGPPYRVVDATGAPHPDLYAFGVPTEGVHWATAAGVRPGVDSVILGDADAVARAVLTALRTPDEERRRQLTARA
ncbi:FAD/NAD(P)-binding protein [Streptomyces catenulae]|uniref:FAD/NAD(P)-binding protein n=1 Tax=Streptomyces catenulae TaxID=66875 RepID=A0ABV2Z0D9_9ACTN|nr:FAD/NAD(P)-binding protein [Streptomyces catenulae]